MSDENAIETPALPEVVAQEAKTVGDAAVQAEVHEAEVTVNTDAVPAQVAGQPESAASEVVVHEVHVATDRVITDTSDPLAVQVPDAGRGDASLPIHALSNGTVEDVFASEAASVEESDNGEPVNPDAQQTIE